MRTTKTIVFTAAILIAWTIALGVAAQADRLSQPQRPTAFSPPELRTLAATGALNPFAPHRRAALWQVAAAW